MAVAATTAGYFSTAHANKVFEDSFVDPAAAALESSLHGPTTPEQIYNVLGAAWFDAERNIKGLVTKKAHKPMPGCTVANDVKDAVLDMCRALWE